MTSMAGSENEMSPAMKGETPPVLEVVSLTKRYGDQPAPSDVGFAVRAGEVLGLIVLHDNRQVVAITINFDRTEKGEHIVRLILLLRSW
jgi:ABC-type sugar transport system ATPase subunit